MERFLLLQLKIGIGLALLTPLMVGPFGISFSEYPKAFFFRTITEILAVLYALLLLWNPSWRPRFTPLATFFLLWIGVQLAAGALGFNWFRSFFGDFFWPQGTILYLHLFAFFLIVSAVLRDRSSWLWLFRWTVFVGFLTAIAAVLQKFGVFHFWGLYGTKGVSGTLSNPVFFGAYLAPVLLLTFFVFSLERRWFLKAAWALLAIGEAVVLAESGSMGAWVGAGAALAFLAFFALFDRLSRVAVRKRAGAACALLALALFAAFLPLFLGMLPALEDKRLTLWQAALEGWKERPVLGWGPESFAYVLDKRVGSQEPAQTFSNHPHNLFLEQLVETGLLGAAAYLALLALAAFLLWRRAVWLTRVQRALLGSVFLAYLVSNLFFSDSVSTALVFVLLLGFLGAQSSGGTNSLPTTKTVSLLVRAGAVILIILAIASFQWVNLQPQRAGMLVVRGAEVELENLDLALDYYERAMRQPTLFDDDLKVFIAERLLSYYGAPGTEDKRFRMLGLLSEAEPVLERKLDSPDKQHRHFFDMLAGIKENRLRSFRNIARAEEMEDIVQRALEEYPGRDDARLLRILSRAHAYQGEYVETEGAFERLLAVRREQAAEPINLTLIEEERQMGRLYWQLGERKRAAEHFLRILQLSQAATSDFSNDYLSMPELLAREAAFTGELIRYLVEDLNEDTAAEEFLRRAQKVYPAELWPVLAGEG